MRLSEVDWVVAMMAREVSVLPAHCCRRWIG